jgi:beta-N-acetylhexosaminidase
VITRRAFLAGAGAATAACAARPSRIVRARPDRDLERRVGQLLFCGWRGGPIPTVLRRRIERSSLGGVVFYRRNAPTAAALAELGRSVRAIAPPGAPILVAATQEGGSIRPLVPEMTAWPAAFRLGERAARSDQDRAAAEALAAAWGRALGDELAAVGVDVDFAPVLDVHTNPSNPIIGERAFSTDAADVARLAGALARGLGDAGVIACGKHFPGHGDTDVDSHVDLPRVARDRARLDAVELAPFRALAPELPMVMTAHVAYPALDGDVPATLSRRITGELLRLELGYRGVVVTDDLEMRAILGRASIEDAAVAAVRAGCDALLVAHHEELQERAAAALASEAARDPALRARVEASASRLGALKRRHVETPRIRPASLAPAAHAALAARLRGE